MIENDHPVWHQTYGFGHVRKTHKNGRISVKFADYTLPKTLDESELSPWDPHALMGGDYE